MRSSTASGGRSHRRPRGEEVTAILPHTRARSANPDARDRPASKRRPPRNNGAYRCDYRARHRREDDIDEHRTTADLGQHPPDIEAHTEHTSKPNRTRSIREPQVSGAQPGS